MDGDCPHGSAQQAVDWPRGAGWSPWDGRRWRGRGRPAPPACCALGVTDNLPGPGTCQASAGLPQRLPPAPPPPALTQDQRAAPQGGSGKRSVGSGWRTRGLPRSTALPLLCFAFYLPPRLHSGAESLEGGARLRSGAGAQTTSLGSLPGTAGSCRRPLALAASPARLAAAREHLLQHCISRRVLLN